MFAFAFAFAFVFAFIFVLLQFWFWFLLQFWFCFCYSFRNCFVQVLFLSCLILILLRFVKVCRVFLLFLARDEFFSRECRDV